MSKEFPPITLYHLHFNKNNSTIIILLKSDMSPLKNKDPLIRYRVLNGEEVTIGDDLS